GLTVLQPYKKSTFYGEKKNIATLLRINHKGNFVFFFWKEEFRMKKGSSENKNRKNFVRYGK
ncbi:MAG: hypothetical protein WAW64_05490, partial [Gemmiger qucibialis]